MTEFSFFGCTNPLSHEDLMNYETLPLITHL